MRLFAFHTKETADLFREKEQIECDVTIGLYLTQSARDKTRFEASGQPRFHRSRERTWERGWFHESKGFRAKTLVKRRMTVNDN